MPRILPSAEFRHDEGDALGIVLVNLGTPDAPTSRSVRRYLREFLSDPRIVELPRWLWLLILYGYILRVRPARSAKAYRKIWTEKGSPLLVNSEALTRSVAMKVSGRLRGNVMVELAMSYGRPSIPAALDRLLAKNCRRLLLLPLYPQYSSTTTASVFAAVTRDLSRRRWIPEFRGINHYHDHPRYIAALAASVRNFRNRNGSGDLLLFSFHGIPRDSLTKGDPYHCHCQKTARLVATSLGLSDAEWKISFQSRVGRQEWLRPYTDETVKQLGAGKLGKLDVICPGFAVDCLETLEEIAMQNAGFFTAAGGGTLRYIEALNDSDDHASMLADLAITHVAGWPECLPDHDPLVARKDSLRLAKAMGAEH
ncbi:MAG TPA: ferrochelatase [Woeseiaceae bacterium]|nr:ferrochelatase [Woeseiaceae bacterium]